MANNDQETEYGQVAHVENGDQDDDDIYDYAPVAWVHHICEDNWFLRTPLDILYLV